MALDKQKEECDFVKNKRMRIRPLGREAESREPA